MRAFIVAKGGKMEQFTPLIWLAAMIFTIVIEAVAPGLVAIWFIPGEVIAMILAFFGVGIEWQIGVFLVVSIVVLIFGRKFGKIFFKKEKTNTDALIGQSALIIEEVCNLESRGAAKLEGKVWSVRSDDDSVTFQVGEYVEVVEIRGVKLICKKK